MSRFSLQRLLERVGQLTLRQRIGICVFSFVLLLSLLGFLVLWPRWQQVERLTREFQQLQTQLTTARTQARHVVEFRNQMAAAELAYREAALALPESQEIPALLAGIAEAGHNAGLAFLLFEPKGETAKSFYAEIPVSITVKGGYHNTALFFDHVARLPRLVNIQDIRMAPPRPGEPLVTSCTAVTYKFVETEAEPEARAEQTSRRTGTRKTGSKK